MDTSSDSWNKKFALGDHYDTKHPFEGIHKIIPYFNENRVKKILDVGCGNGRNLIYLAQQGFDMNGIDLAESGLEQIKEKIKGLELKVNLTKADMLKLPYEDSSFDAAINVWALNHNTYDNICKCVDETTRILKPNGLVYMSASAWKTIYKLIFKLIAKQKIENRTYNIKIGSEEGIHHFFTESDVHNIFKNYNTLFLDRKRYYGESPIKIPFLNFLGRKKS